MMGDQDAGFSGEDAVARSYAYSIALFLRWCARSGRTWQSGVEQIGLFMMWLAHAIPGAPGEAGGALLRGPGASPARGARRVNAVLAAVRGMTVHAVAEGTAGGHLVPVLYEVADDRDLPGEARAGDGRMSWRLRARHRACEVDAPVSRTADADIAALLAACVSARDRLIVMLLARAGLRRGEAAGLRRSDVHLLADSRLLGCEVPRAHLHVVRREDNPNGAWAKSRRQRVVPLDFLTVQAFDTYQLERAAVAAAADGDFVLVNLFRSPVGAPMRLDAINELLGAASRRAGIDPPVRPHQLRHAFGSNVEIGRIASDASFGRSRERMLPAAQRAALGRGQRAGAPGGARDLGYRQLVALDARMRQLIRLRWVTACCIRLAFDASGLAGLHQAHHRASRG